MQTWQRIKRLFWRGAASDVVAGRTFDLVAQGSHVGWGIALVLGPVALFGPLALWPAALVTLFGFALKESVVDPAFQSAAVRGSGWRDFVFESIGTLTGLGLFLWTR